MKSQTNKRQNIGPQTITGIISTIAKGAGFIDGSDPEAESIYIEPGFLNTALNGDKVEVDVDKGGTATVTKIIERSRETFVGRVVIEDGKYILIPDDKKIYVKISLQGYIDKGNDLDIKEDLKVLVKLNPWTNPLEMPTGEVVRVIGKKGLNDVEMESIVLENGFDTRFPPEVEKEAEEIRKNQSEITAEEVAKRRDMRDTLNFTIDPFDAKDFDDAISFKKLSEKEIGGIDGLSGAGPFYEIGIHIADVSHYMREGSALDKEALKRGCSVYLVDRTIPMLPEILSNELCSLRPNEDKLTFSAVFILDDKAKVHHRWFGRTVTRSTHRFTYETAQAVIDGEPARVEKYSNGIQKQSSVEEAMKYRDVLVELNRLAKILTKEKFLQGAIEFEQEEIKFRLDPTGKPIGVYKKERLDTHKLVEEYMLLANREVASFISESIKKKGGKNFGAIYRIHDIPDKEKMKNLSFFVRALGYKLTTEDGVVTAHAINHLLEQVENMDNASLIRTATIRSMQKAIYSTQNIGHFGLAFKFYTHFTSPIRRYPDVLVHRILQNHLTNIPAGTNDIARLQNMAESSTNREIDAADAERASVKLKQVEYMRDFIGQTFEGRISGVTRFGLYVEENQTRSEGMIPIRNLGNDFFNFDEKTYSIIGERTKKKFTLGDQVKFKVLAADLDKRTLEYALI